MIIVKDILKVIDVDRKDVSSRLIDWLGDVAIEYRDKVTSEHLYNVIGAMDNILDLSIEDSGLIVGGEEEYNQLQRLLFLCSCNQAAYVRFIEA